MPDIHSLISPSYLHTLIACNKALPIDSNYVEEENPQAHKGTIQHALLQSKLSTFFNKEVEEVEGIEELDTTEIAEVEDVYNYIINRYNKIKKDYTDIEVLIEEKLDLDSFLPSPSWGFVDFGLCAKSKRSKNSQVWVFDAKFGRISVPTEDQDGPNPQLLAYSWGIVDLYSDTRKISKVSLNICQPKLNNYPTTTLSINKANEYIETVITPAAVHYEKERLIKEGHIKQADLVKRVSEDDDSLGYDVLSFEYNMKGHCIEKHIEVKTTNSSSPDLNFYITQNEINHFLNNNENHYIYFLSSIYDNPKLHIVDKNSFKKEFLEPVLYKVNVKVKKKETI